MIREIIGISSRKFAGSMDAQALATMIQDAIHLTNREMNALKSGVLTAVPMGQLALVHGVLCRLGEQLRLGDLPPAGSRNLGLGQMIVDSWPFDYPLGSLVLNIEHSYRTL